MKIFTLLLSVTRASLLVIETEDEPSPEVPFDLLSSGTAELESLLHFAIRHSDKSKLRELASRPPESIQNLSHVLDFMYAKDTWFEDLVNRTLIEQSWTTLEEWEEAFDFIQDYGDHLLDKGELLQSMGALAPLIDWLVTFSLHNDPKVFVRVPELVFAITQNRESAQALIVSHRPGIVRDLFYIVRNEYHCLKDSRNDQVCGALISVLYSLLGNNESMQHHMDEDMLVPLAESVKFFKVPSAVFTRTVSLFRVIQALSNSVDMQWKSALDWDLLLSHVGTVDVHLGEQIVALSEPNNRGSVALAKARDRLEQQCRKVKGSEHQWCDSLQIETDHTEL